MFDVTPGRTRTSPSGRNNKENSSYRADKIFVNPELFELVTESYLNTSYGEPLLPHVNFPFDLLIPYKKFDQFKNR